MQPCRYKPSTFLMVDHFAFVAEQAAPSCARGWPTGAEWHLLVACLGVALCGYSEATCYNLFVFGASWGSGTGF